MVAQKVIIYPSKVFLVKYTMTTPFFPGQSVENIADIISGMKR